MVGPGQDEKCFSVSSHTLKTCINNITNSSGKNALYDTGPLFIESYRFSSHTSLKNGWEPFSNVNQN